MIAKKRSAKPTPRAKPGPKTAHLKIEGSWERAVGRATLRKVRDEIASLYMQERYFGTVYRFAEVDEHEKKRWLAALDAILKERE